ncbi:Zinc finger MYM-type protein [Corchorus olitorius]|uniref:Zinc finger MYM-type protein n=1 Tax=Corchorus olitorius TaxID=93759 RepID=A0A1R3KCV9_9ROSI|nr:Zinc finger MYM-type protein [Corchorus olitorius]
MGKRKTIDSFFKKEVKYSLTTESFATPNLEQSPSDKQPHVASPSLVKGSSRNPSTNVSNEQEKIDTALVYDPGLRPPIWDYPINQRDEFSRKYVNAGPYRHMLTNYPYSGEGNNCRRFQASWFTSFHWLEYSPAKDAAYCLPCYLFTDKPSERPEANAFIVEGF